FEVQYEFDKQLQTNISTAGGWSIKKDGQKNGIFERTKNNLKLVFENNLTSIYQDNDDRIVRYDNEKKISWRKIDEEDELYTLLIIGYGECKNRLKYMENIDKNNFVNENGWGKGTVYLNFDTSNPITIG
ncbi:MAG: hypothetical protein ABIR18_06990, partial [Chitinophagaceae bacterium]